MIEAVFSDGLLGQFLEWKNELVFVTCPRAFAPGAPIRLELKLESGPMPIELRSIGSKKRPDGLFEVRGRTINLKRDDRLRLDALPGA